MTGPTSHIATDTSVTLTMQSKNGSGVSHDVTTDIYSVVFTRSDGGGSEIYSTTATYSSAGLYDASLSPTVAGTYAVTVDMTNAYTTADPSVSTVVSGSPYSLTVVPGVVDPV